MTIEEMKKRKKEMGYSNRDLSEKTGIPIGTLQKIMSGATKAPRRTAVKALEDVLQDQHTLRTRPLQSDCFAADRSVGKGFVSERPLSYLRSSSGHFLDEQFRDNGNLTLNDYYALPEDRRAELIDGVIYDMAAPSAVHQELLLSLAYQLKNHILKNRGDCRVFVAPYDVQLDQDDRTMVQPDISVVCDSGKNRKSGCFGAPDFVVEILSPSSVYRDTLIKLGKYMGAGVREYWMVDPENKRVTVCLNRNKDIILRMYTFSDQIPVDIWQGRCTIDFAEIYRDISYSYNLDD